MTAFFHLLYKYWIEKELILLFFLCCLIVRTNAQSTVTAKLDSTLEKNRTDRETNLSDILTHDNEAGFWETVSHDQNWEFAADSTFSTIMQDPKAKEYYRFSGNYFTEDNQIHFNNILILFSGIPGIDYFNSDLDSIKQTNIAFSNKIKFSSRPTNDSVFFDTLLLVKPQIKIQRARLIGVVIGEMSPWVFENEKGDTIRFSGADDFLALLEKDQILGRWYQLKTVRKIIVGDYSWKTFSNDYILSYSEVE